MNKRKQILAGIMAVLMTAAAAAKMIFFIFSVLNYTEGGFS